MTNQKVFHDYSSSIDIFCFALLVSGGFAPMNSGGSDLGKIHNTITSCCFSSIDRFLDFGIFITCFLQTVSEDCSWNTIAGVLWIEPPPNLVWTLQSKLFHKNIVETYNNKQTHFNQMLQLLLDPRPRPEGSCKKGSARSSVRPSFRLSVRFSRIGSLVFSKT